MAVKNYKAIVIGGSAGSFLPLMKIITGLDKPLRQSVFICLHRLRYIRDGLVESYQPHANMIIKEPLDKEAIEPEHIYMAPANYHLQIENEEAISLCVDELVNYSRPSIDILFESAAQVYSEGLVGIILSGANWDGVNGMACIKDWGGTTIVQDPEESQMKTMPSMVLEKVKVDHQLTADGILKFLLNLN